MSLLRNLICSVIITFPFLVHSQEVRTVSITHTYVAPLSISVLEARRLAVESAMTEALRREYGTFVTESVQKMLLASDGQSQENFYLLGGTAVKGKWLETIGKPKFDDKVTDDNLIINVTLSGKVKEISHNPIPIEVKTLRNGTDDASESSDFTNDDDFYLSFSTPVDGYVAVYMLDADSDVVYQLLPYANSKNGSEQVIPNVRYVFFSKDFVRATERKWVTEYQLVGSDDHLTWNVIYVVFSPNDFSKSIAFDKINGVKALPSDRFFKWIGDVQIRDEKANVEIHPLKVHNPNSQK